MTDHAHHSRMLAGGFFTRFCRAAVFSLTLPALLCCTVSCARQPSEAGKFAMAQETMRQIDPSPMRLSPEAQQMYYNLLLADGMSENAELVIRASLQKLIQLDPTPEMYANATAILLSRGDGAHALQTVAQGLARHPDDARLTRFLAGIHAENGQIPRAIELLEAFIKTHPNSPDALDGLMRLYLSTGQNDRAAALLSQLPSSDQSPETVLFRAGVLSSVGRGAEAKKMLQRLLRKDPKVLEAWLELGLIAMDGKDFKGALAAFKKAADLTPDNDDITLRIASLHILLKEPDLAERYLNKASHSPVLYLQASARFFESGHPQHADRMLNRATELGGSPDEINIVRSMIRQEQSKTPEESLAPLSAVPSSSPLYSSALLQRARIFLNAEKYDQLIATAREGQNRFPEVGEFIKLEAYGLLRTDKAAEAVALMKKNLDRSPNDEFLLYAYGTVLDTAGRKQEAMAAMEKLLSLHPDNYQALNYVGYTLAEQNTNLERALNLITTALEQRPDADYIVDSLAWVLYRLGRFEEAWTAIRRCIELGGEEAAIWEHYGDIALALGKRDEAAKGYRRALERKPENSAEVQRKLDGLGQRK